MQQPPNTPSDGAPSDEGWSDGPRPATIGANAVDLDPAQLDSTLIGSQTASDYFDQVAIAHSSLDNVTDAAAGTDGRTLRRTRNREAVIRSLLELMRAGAIEPTVAEIAELAGVSHRSVFRYFDDLTDLVRAAFEHELVDAIPLAVIPGLGEGPLAQRVDSFVDARLRVFSHTYQVARTARLRAVTVPAIDESLRAVSTLLRMQLRNHFRNELSALDPTDAEFTVDAILALFSFEAYDMQLRILDHNPERIRQVWCRALATLLRT